MDHKQHFVFFALFVADFEVCILNKKFIPFALVGYLSKVQ